MSWPLSRCVCGKEFGSTVATPWSSATCDDKGNVISGVCIHGVVFPPGSFKLKDEQKDKKD